VQIIGYLSVVIRIRYQIAILGRAWFEEQILTAEIHKQFMDLGISTDEYVIIPEVDTEKRNGRAPFVAAFFGYLGAKSSDHPELESIIEDSLPVIPCLIDLDNYKDKVPSELEATNGLAIGEGQRFQVTRLVACIMENLSLLRTDRRVFISYRRSDTREIALQLYDALQSRNFDTYLDTHSMRAGIDMQDHLWHRLADSDIVILLDSPAFRSSKWTMMEHARANSTSVQMLHLLWPEVEEDPYSSLSEFHRLASADFDSTSEVGVTARLSEPAIADICFTVESLRARALALRHAYLVDQFCDLCREAGVPVTLHPERYISIERSGGMEIFVPAVGVPNAYRINQIEQAVHANHSASRQVSVIFDNRGLLKSWISHIEWLNSHLKIRSLPATEIKAYVGGI
jgi:hypothetical protein